MQELIGQGSFAEVYRGIYNNTEVAVKIIKNISRKEDSEKAFFEEAGIMITLRHPHIVLFMGACFQNPNLFLVTEYLSNGSVRELLDDKDIIIEPEHIRKFLIDSCKGMTYLHSRKIIHRDLKTHNLLIDNNWNVKVADFGLSRSMVESDATLTACGTPSWAAPEVLRRDHYTYKADVYSFAICLWEMSTRSRPYGNLKPYQVAIGVVKEGMRPDLTLLIIPYFMNLMVECWADEPDNRPDFTLLRDELEAIILPIPQYGNPIDTKMADIRSKSLPDIHLIVK